MNNDLNSYANVPDSTTVSCQQLRIGALISSLTQKINLYNDVIINTVIVQGCVPTQKHSSNLFRGELCLKFFSFFFLVMLWFPARVGSPTCRRQLATCDIYMCVWSVCKSALGTKNFETLSMNDVRVSAGIERTVVCGNWNCLNWDQCLCFVMCWPVIML